MKKQVILDVHGGQKQLDAVKLLIQAQRCEVAGITAVWGETPFDAAQDQICAAVGDAVPVYAGCPGPLARHLYQKNAVLPAAVKNAGGVQREHAVSYLVRACRNAEEAVTLAAMGPLTNIAMALRIAPDIAGKIREVIVVDTLQEEDFASENLRRDPEAAQMVVRGGVALTLLQLGPDADAAGALGWALEESNADKGAKTHVQISIDRGLAAGVVLCNAKRQANARIITEEDMGQ